MSLGSTLKKPSMQSMVAVEPSSNLMIEPKEDAVPVAHGHPETRKGVYVKAPEAELVMV
jgi:hypothetical protein